MKRCAHCRGRFGLIRYTAYRAFGNIIQFCCKKCERAYFDERRKEAQSLTTSIEVSLTSAAYQSKVLTKGYAEAKRKALHP